MSHRAHRGRTDRSDRARHGSSQSLLHRADLLFDLQNAVELFAQDQALPLNREPDGEGLVDNRARPIGSDFLEREGGMTDSGRLWKFYTFLAQMLGYSGNYGPAVALLERSMEIDESELQAGLLKIKYHFLMNDLEGARETLHWLNANDTKRIEGYTTMIERYNAFFVEHDSRKIPQ